MERDRAGAERDTYSGVVEVCEQQAHADDLEAYRPKLDEMWGVFGEDRVLYGSDWPNSEPLGPYPKVLSIVQRYVSEKSRSIQEKYFWRNSVKAYRWKKRAENQPG